MVFIKTKMVLSLKFYPKLNGTPCQHQSLTTMCHIINFFALKKIYIFSKKLKNKNFGGGWPPPLAMGVAGLPPSSQFGGGEPPLRPNGGGSATLSNTSR